MKIAEYYNKSKDNVVSCLLCPHYCVIKDGKSGICGARKNIGGDLQSLNYGVVSSLSFDPIEKKPLYHFYPGSQILSIGTLGCNLHCPFCQNYSLSRYFDEVKDQNIKPNHKSEDLLELLRKNTGKSKFSGIAYTYSEPMIWYEFVLDTSKLLKIKGYKNVLVTNGFINPEPLAKLLPFIDAVNIDLKAFTEQNYKKLGGKLAPVLDTITAFHKAGVHVELTTLVVTGFNDNLEELENLVQWVSRLNRSIPLHFSRYFPQYRYHQPSTDGEFLRQVANMAKGFLDYVYLGNINDDGSSFCPKCGNKLVERAGYNTAIVGIQNGNCSNCGRQADFILNGR